jgi:hypothetical protein
VSGSSNSFARPQSPPQACCRSCYWRSYCLGDRTALPSSAWPLCPAGALRVPAGLRLRSLLDSPLYTIVPAHVPCVQERLSSTNVGDQCDDWLFAISVVWFAFLVIAIAVMLWRVEASSIEGLTDGSADPASGERRSSSSRASMIARNSWGPSVPAETIRDARRQNRVPTQTSVMPITMSEMPRVVMRVNVNDQHCRPVPQAFVFCLRAAVFLSRLQA